MRYFCFMQFEDLIGLENIRAYLKKTVHDNRIPHAQLFVGGEGTGTLATAIAYAQYVLTFFAKTEQDKKAIKLKCEKLVHPDIHFTFPVSTTDKVKKNPISDDFMEEWRLFIKNNPYSSLYDWMKFLNIEKKQGNISKFESDEISKKLSLKSFEGGYKVLIVWMAEKLSSQSAAPANKLLKLIEEPPKNTLIILVAEEEELIMKTILSRCQVLHFPKVNEENMVNELVSTYNCSNNEALKIVHQVNGNLNKAIKMVKNEQDDSVFETWFITWIRAAFRAKGNASVIEHLIDWSKEIAGTGRETQKRFLHYCLQFFRQALLMNYQANELVYLETTTPNFKLENFAPFVHSKNIMQINEQLNNAIYHIERNGNPKIILLDISIQLTRLLHQKEN